MATKEKRKAAWQRSSGKRREWRVDVFRYAIVAFALLILGRLFILQVLDHGFYAALASGQHEFFQELIPRRGSVYTRELKGGEPVPVATNRQLAFVYADPRHVEDPRGAAEAIGEILGYEPEAVDRLAERLDAPEDPYEPIQRRVDDAALDRILELELAGIFFAREDVRHYPEPGMGGHVIGFFGANEDGSLSGKYGVEGHFDEELSGTRGYIRSERDIAGRLIAIGERSVERAVDGADIVLTIDRTIQYHACESLRQAVETYQADGGSVVILEPSTGRVLAMCGAPDFDPADYGHVESISAFNNPAIFSAYEPGSIFKPVTIAAGLDAGVISPTTTYEDTGVVTIEEFDIRNSDDAAHGRKTMTEALEESLNLGMIFAMRQLGPVRFGKYVQDFGFGERTGIRLSTEVPGALGGLETGHEIYAATVSFGQGITTTPLQMAAAYAAIANGGTLKRPYVVEEIRRGDGVVERTQPTDIRRVIDARAASLVGAMLVSVVEHGHAGEAGVPGYYLAGKTGTAQVAKEYGVGYQEGVTIASFAGFGPVEDPRFAMVVRLDHPRSSQWASQTAAPLFGEISRFLLTYLEVPPSR